MGKSYGTRTAWKPRGRRTWENQKTCKSRKQKNKPKEPQNFETTWDASRNEPKPLLQKHAFSALQNYQSGAFQNEAPPITDNTKRLHPPIFWFGPQPLHNASQTPPSRVGKVDLHALTCWDPRMSFSASIDSTLGQAHMLHASETPPISLALALPLRHSDWMQSISGHTSIILEGIHAFALDTQPGKIGQPASFKSSYGPHHTKGYPCLENSTTIGHSVTDHSTVLLGNFQNDAHQDSDHCDCYLSIAKTSYNGWQANKHSHAQQRCGVGIKALLQAGKRRLYCGKKVLSKTFRRTDGTTCDVLSFSAFRPFKYIALIPFLLFNLPPT